MIRKSARPKGRTRGSGLFHVVDRTIFPFGGGHWFLCDEEGVGVHGEDLYIESEPNLLVRGVLARHDF